MDRTTNNNPSNRTIFFIIERINSPPFTGRPFKSHAIYFPFVFSYLVRSISKSFIGARFLPRLFTPASSLFDETISKLNEISKARSNVYEQGDRGRTINVIPTRDRKLYLFNGARFARFSSPSRESTRDGERKRIILATLFRRPDQIPIFFAFGSRNIGRKGDSDSTPVQIEFRFSILSRLVVPRTMREQRSILFSNYARIRFLPPPTKFSIFPCLRIHRIFRIFSTDRDFIARCLDILWKLFFYAIEAWQMGRTMDPLHTL